MNTYAWTIGEAVVADEGPLSQVVRELLNVRCRVSDGDGNEATAGPWLYRLGPPDPDNFEVAISRLDDPEGALDQRLSWIPPDQVEEWRACADAALQSKVDAQQRNRQMLT